MTYILIRDKQPTKAKTFPMETQDEKVAAAAAAFSQKLEETSNSLSHDNALKNIAELKELIDVLDCLHGRDISRLQLTLRKTWGGYDQWRAQNG